MAGRKCHWKSRTRAWKPFGSYWKARSGYGASESATGNHELAVETVVECWKPSLATPEVALEIMNSLEIVAESLEIMVCSGLAGGSALETMN